MLIGGEEADGLSQEGAGSERRADWLGEAVRERIAERAGRGKTVVVGGDVAGGCTEALLVVDGVRGEGAGGGEAGKTLGLDEDAEPATYDGFGVGTVREAKARAEEAGIGVIGRAVGNVGEGQAAESIDACQRGRNGVG